MYMLKINLLVINNVAVSHYHFHMCQSSQVEREQWANNPTQPNHQEPLLWESGDPAMSSPVNAAQDKHIHAQDIVENISRG